MERLLGRRVIKEDSEEGIRPEVDLSLWSDDELDQEMAKRRAKLRMRVQVSRGRLIDETGSRNYRIEWGTQYEDEGRDGISFVYCPGIQGRPEGDSAYLFTPAKSMRIVPEQLKVMLPHLIAFASNEPPPMDVE